MFGIDPGFQEYKWSVDLAPAHAVDPPTRVVVVETDEELAARLHYIGAHVPTMCMGARLDELAFQYNLCRRAK